MMHKYLRNISWDFFSKIIIFSFAVLQIIRWRMLPQSMDIYYHLLTAWGFIQAGGYSGWDFWQYAPVGRIHIYPPLFHLVLAILIKIGVNKVILARIFEIIIPVVFLIVVRHFIRRNYSGRLAFFIMLVTGSSFSFYMNLINHIPATLAIIFGILVFDNLLDKRLLRSALLLTLCFYTHIGVSWLFSAAIIFYSLFNKQYRKSCLGVFILSLALSMPILFKQLIGLKAVSRIGLNLAEREACQFKIIEYVLAFFGLTIVLKLNKKYRLFFSLFLASSIFLLYPYRFFSAEGYLPVIFLSAVTLDSLYDKLRGKNRYTKSIFILLLIFIFVISPTISMDKIAKESKINYKLFFAHSAFTGLVFPSDVNRGFFNSIWFPYQYLPAASFIKQNSQNGDIIYSTINLLGLCLASLSERATVNALFPEIAASKTSKPVDIYSVSKIIIAAKDDDPHWLSYIENNYKLIKLSENKTFIFYKNPSCHTKLIVRGTSVPFGIVLLVSLVFIILFWKAKKIEEFMLRVLKIYLT